MQASFLGEGALARSWPQLLVGASCATVAAARQAAVDWEESPLGRTLRLGTTIAAAALVAQLLPAGGRRGGEEDRDENTDASLTWREDEGLTKLVPLLPEPRQQVKDPLPRFTMAEVAGHNTRADLWIIVDGRAYDVTNFVDKHPGGALPIENMAGKDCTDVFANYHAARVYKYMLPPYLVGEVSDYAVFPHVADFRAIRQELLRRGLFKTDMRFYAKMGTWLVALFCCALWLSIGCTSCGAHMCGAAVLGIFWQQLAGIGHDLGHSGVTHVFWLDHMIGSALAALMGISTCWWKRNHNTHHVVCNSVEHDPDIQHMPIIAVTPRVFEKPFWSTYYTKQVAMDAVARFLVSHQPIVFYPMMMVARFNLYAQSWIQLMSKEHVHYRCLEIGALLLYAAWVLTVALSMPTWRQTAGWLAMSHAVSGILHVQIVISHWAMETYHGHAYNDDKDEWYITQMKTTMNVATPPLLDWVHIGLQFQIEHHLYPRLPRHNLRKARELVKAVCKKHGIHYHEPGFFQANFETMRALISTAQSAQNSKRGDSGFYESALWDGLKLTG
mmetsp:Transcript_59198/g.183831  ORF Transcript_59198/g.183831 Transcript_59198/m.183831 type:complete len:557 (-) Transcript_59198:226-1896(-)